MFTSGSEQEVNFLLKNAPRPAAMKFASSEGFSSSSEHPNFPSMASLHVFSMYPYSDYMLELTQHLLHATFGQILLHYISHLIINHTPVNFVRILIALARFI